MKGQFLIKIGFLPDASLNSSNLLSIPISMKRYICQDCGHQMITAQKPSACEVCSGTILLPFVGKKAATGHSSKPSTLIDVSGFGVKKTIKRPSSEALPPLPPPPPPALAPTRRPFRHNPGSLDSTMMNVAPPSSIQMDSSMLASYHQPRQIYKQRQHPAKISFPLKKLFWGGLICSIVGVMGYFINAWWMPFFKADSFTKVILEDNFSASQKWSLTHGSKIKNGGLFHLQPYVKHYGKSIWTGYKFINVDFSADAKKINGPENVPYGLVTRLGGENYENFYYLMIAGNGTWIMGKHTKGSWEKQGKWHKSQIINKGNQEMNKLRMVVKGDLVIGYINGKRVGHFRDKSFQSGYIAVTSFRGTGDAVAVYFDNVVAKIEDKSQ